MTVVAKPLFNAQQTAAVEVAIYSPPVGTRAIIDKFTAFNSTGATATLAIKIYQSGGVAGSSNQIVLRSIISNETYTFPEIVGHVMNGGDVLSVLQGTANALTLRASGREIT